MNIQQTYTHIIYALILVLTLTLSVLANDSSGVKKIATPFTFWQNTYQVAVEGNYAYVAQQGGGLIVLDISDIYNVKEIALRNTPGSAVGVAVNGNYCYVADEGGGFIIYDVSTPANPLYLSTTNKYRTCNAIYVLSPSYILVIYNSYGTAVFDVSDPLTPQFVTEVCSRVGSLCVTGNLVYMSLTDEPLRVYDFTDPTKPTILSQMPQDPFYPTCIVGNETLCFYTEQHGGRDITVVDLTNKKSPRIRSKLTLINSPHQLWLYGGLLYAISGFDNIHVFDYRNPDSLKQIGFIKGDYYVAQGKISIYDGFFYGPTNRGYVCIYDVRNPTKPTAIGEIGNRGRGTGIAISRTYCYITSGEQGLHIFDISNPRAPILISADSTNIYYDVAVTENYCYIAGNGYMWVFDTGDPKNLQELARIRSEKGSFSQVSVDGDWCALVERWYDQEYFTHYAYHLVDVSNPGMPVITATVGGNINTPEIVLKDGYLYEGVWNGGTIWDLTDPYKPHQISDSLVFMTASHDISVWDTLCVFNGGDSGVTLINVANPAKPVRLSTVHNSPVSRDLLLYGTNCFTALGKGGFTITDISDPNTPLRSGFYTDDGFAVEMAVYEHYLFTINGAELAIYDCSVALGVEDENVPMVPTALELEPVHPNPFNSTTTVPFSLRKSGHTRLTVYDVNGRSVAQLIDSDLPAGSYSAQFTAGDQPSGVYLIKLEQASEARVAKMVLVR